MRQRDNQKSRVYRAEEAAYSRVTGQPTYKQTIPNDRLQEWADRVLARRAVHNRWPFAKVNVRLGRGGASEWCGIITLGVGFRNEWVMLHELAHYLNVRHHADHGPEFAGILLYLVKTVLGKESYDVLLEEFKGHRVRRSNKGIPAPIKIIYPRRIRSGSVAA